MRPVSDFEEQNMQVEVSMKEPLLAKEDNGKTSQAPSPVEKHVEGIIERTSPVHEDNTTAVELLRHDSTPPPNPETEPGALEAQDQIKTSQKTSVANDSEAW